MNNNTTVKLPVKEYISSLKNFISAQENSTFDTYKVFDYRVKDQLILNWFMNTDDSILIVEINETNYTFNVV